MVTAVTGGFGAFNNWDADGFFNPCPPAPNPDCSQRSEQVAVVAPLAFEWGPAAQSHQSKQALMSYVTYNPQPTRPRRRARAPQPVYPAYPIQPLSAAGPPVKNNAWRGILIAIAVVVGLLVLLYVLDRHLGEQPERDEPDKPKRRRVEKMSTEALAKNLYKRLEKKGHASDATMNALRQIGKRR